MRAVFLDAGGTLIHLDGPFIVEALAALGVSRDLAAFARADRAARSAVAAWMHAGNTGDDTTRWRIFAQTLLAELGCDERLAAGMRAAVGARHQQGRLWSLTLAGTREALAALRRQGLVVGVVSNADGRVASFLEYAGLRDELDFVIDSGIVGVEKPDPRIFALACERAGVTAAEAIHVGDVYEIDVLGARAAGVTPLLFDPDDFYPDRDCPRIRSIAELPGLLLAGLRP